MEIADEVIILFVDYEGEDIVRPLLLSMKRVPAYKRLLRAPHTVFVTFLLCLIVLYFVGWISFGFVLLAAIVSILVSAFVNPILFELLAKLTASAESRFRKNNPKLPRLGYKFVLNNGGITKEWNHNISISNWTEIREAIETEEDITLSHYDGSEDYFPKRVFNEFDELVHFKNFIRQRISNRAKF